ncbi:MAG: hypothetical protein INR65_06575 [Gluconacetobacter diazotrophicus]|nr:hypothetical protein [Gluconacetobacter diazotrophicus]
MHPAARFRSRDRPLALPACAGLFAVLLLSRDPPILFHAQFWGEDGWFWFPQARSDGLLSLLHPANGYLQTVSRLVALAVSPLPLRFAPTAYALAAFVIQLLPPLVLASHRLAGVLPDGRARLMLALLLVAVPGETEVYVNLTNAQWHLAVLGFLLLLADAPPSSRAASFDTALLALSALSGPFDLVLLPVAMVEAARRRSRQTIRNLLLLAAGAALQLGCLLATASGARSSQPLGAGPVALARILSGQVVVTALFGREGFAAVSGTAAWRTGVLPVAVLVAAASVTALALMRGNRLFRQACLFAALLLLAELSHPQASGTGPQWPALAIPDNCSRYFLIPVLVWLGGCITLLATPVRAARILAACCLSCTLAVAIPRDWHRPDEPDRGFPALAARFDRSPPGIAFSLPIRPNTEMFVIR